MKTFEEYRFRIKHSSINNKVYVKEKPIKDLKVGDWFYCLYYDEDPDVNNRSYVYCACQITKVEKVSEYMLELHYTRHSSDGSWYASFYNNDGTTTHIKNDHGESMITTSYEDAKEFASKNGIENLYKEYPAE